MVGPKASLAPGEEPQDRPGHDVRGRVPQDVERLAVLRGQEPQLDRPAVAVLQRPVEVDDRAVGHGGDRRLGQPLADPLGDLAGAGSLGNSLTDPSGSLIWTIWGKS